MKLTRAEKIILVLTLLFLAFTLGVHFGGQQRDNFTISTHPRGESVVSAGDHGGIGKVNINTAGKEALMLLPGIGEVLAERIIAYREEHGLFASIDHITRVEGIGNGIYSKICTSITVE